MKRYITYTAILLASALCSCTDFLDEQLQDDYNGNKFFTNEANAQRSIIGAYNTIGFTSADNYLWVFGDIASDDSVKGGNPGDMSAGEEIDHFEANSDNGIIAIYWKYAYETVSQANNIIAYVPGIDMDAALRSRIVGEAKFLRALSYFHIVNIWGSVPLRKEPNQNNNANIVLSDPGTVYQLIKDDLRDAIASPLSAEYSSPDAGRASLGAAYALMAKVYLFEKNYGECLSAIASLQALNLYELEDDYADLFKLGAEDSKEAIFVARHLSDQNPGLGNILNVYFAPQQENGYYFNAPTESFVESFDELTVDGGTDPRLDASIGRPGQMWMNGEVFDDSWTSNNDTPYLVRKYNQPLSEVTIGRKSDGGLPFMYLRYADVLLMKAEALAYRNANSQDLEDAAAALDEVRGRADLAPTTATTQEALLSAIRKERRRELGFESHRFFDLMRWGKEIAEAALGEDFAGKWTGDRYYFPLPLSETDVNQAIE